MKKGTVIALIIAACCLVAGICIMAAALIGIDFHVKELSVMEPKTTTHTVSESFLDIDIRTIEADIKLLPAEDGTCRVVCEETDKISHAVTVAGNTLTIRRHDSRKWYEKINLYFPTLSLTVYLPQEEYAALTLQSVSGDITISDAFYFGNTAISSTSGNLTDHARTNGNLTASTVSGNITLSQHTGGHLAVSTTSGEIHLRDMSASAVSVSTTSGNIAMTDVVAVGMLQAESVSGEVYLTRVDGDRLTLSTVSGNITASLLSGKDFSYDTVSGHVSLPPDTAGAGACQLETTSGNIRITIEA
ncbi:MAG: DUF4097 family beta strand repeat protein [Clostridia bacterium]|nr:DUF4097 family beta strand repeat protein [Clostridia bacterium]